MLGEISERFKYYKYYNYRMIKEAIAVVRQHKKNKQKVVTIPTCIDKIKEGDNIHFKQDKKSVKIRKVKIR